MIGVREAELGFRAERLGLIIESRSGRHLLLAAERSKYGEVHPRLVYPAHSTSEALAFLEGARYRAAPIPFGRGKPVGQ